MRIEHDLGTFDRPRMEGSILHVSASEGTTVEYIVTEDFIAVDYMRKDNDEIDWFFYLNDQNVKWERLSDEQRLMVRMSLRSYLTSHTDEWSEWNPGEYEDDRYYILEGLEVR